MAKFIWKCPFCGREFTDTPVSVIQAHRDSHVLQMKAVKERIHPNAKRRRKN